MAPAVLAERELLTWEARDLKPATAPPSCGDDGGHGALKGQQAEGNLAEGKEESLAAKVSTAEGVRDREEDREEEGARRPRGVIPMEKTLSPETMAPSMKVLQRGASSLLRFLVAVSMRQASLAGSTGSQGARSQAPASKAPSRVKDMRQPARGGQKLSSSQASEIRTASGGAADGLVSATALPMPQTRERSMYGTPLKEMQMHVDNLHQV